MIPKVIDRTQNVIIGHGTQDFVLIMDGTLLAIQNMTWGGRMGFQSPPVAPLYIPYHANDDFTTVAGSGIMGTTHKERGLTYIAVGPAGHFLTLDAPSVAFRSMEILLGRIPDFQSVLPFTIDTNNTAQTSSGTMGNGTVLIGNGGVISRATAATRQAGGSGAAGEAEANQASKTQASVVSLIGMVVLLSLLL